LRLSLRWQAKNVHFRNSTGAHQHGNPGVQPGTGVDWHKIQPGKPQRNAFAESLIGRLHDALSKTLFSSLIEDRTVLAAWRNGYNPAEAKLSAGQQGT
jgi:transposase InsO family protein